MLFANSAIFISDTSRGKLTEFEIMEITYSSTTVYRLSKYEGLLLTIIKYAPINASQSVKITSR